MSTDQDFGQVEQDPVDTYRFDSALHEGIEALMRSFGNHGFRTDEFFDREDFKACLMPFLELEMRKAFPAPETTSAPSP